MASAEFRNPPTSGRKNVLVAVVVLLFVVAAASWTGWQLWVESPRQESAAREKAFDVTPVARRVAAPAFLGLTPEGRPFTLAELRGQVVFVNFWATWCPPCREEMPSMLQLGRELSERHPGKFRMVAVSVDDGWPEVLQFFGGRLPGGVTFLHDPDQKATRDYYCQARGSCPDSFKFPETYIVDASGNLVSYVVGPRDWNDPAARGFLERLIR